MNSRYDLFGLEQNTGCVDGMAEKARDAPVRDDAARLTCLLDDGIKAFPDDHGRSPLLLAAAAGHADSCEILILRGADVNAVDNTGVTSLQRAAAEGHVEVIELLLKHGADVARQDTTHGNSALHEAAWRGYSRTVAALAKALGTQRAPLHARNFAGFAPLHLACQNGHNQTCRELLLAGCNPDLQNNYGDTPLHTSARYGHAGVTRILISALCQVSKQNKNGDTALHIAAAMGRRKLTRILLEAGCDRSLRNKQDETAKDIARRKNLTEILEIMHKARSKSRSRSKSRGEESQDKVDWAGDGRGVKKRENNESGTSGSNRGDKKKDKKKHKAEKQHKSHFGKGIMGKQWSPYGCHYYPDLAAFPQPRLDSLPSDPLGRGEQYYLDLAGNIRKGPVGVGYTCYCAPFFRHMEAKIEQNKADLKAHIDKAHERLDLKVANLERRTRVQVSELTRCVALERSRCEERHGQLQRQMLSRGVRGRRSERPMRTTLATELSPPIRARSLEDLLDERQPRNYQEFEKKHEQAPAYAGSLDDLDLPAIPRLSKSMKELPSSILMASKTAFKAADESAGKRLEADCTSASLAVSSPSLMWAQQLHHRVLLPGEFGTSSYHEEQGPTRKSSDGNSENRKSSSQARRSVHEIIKRFQQVSGLHNGWRTQRSSSPDQNKSSQRHKSQSQGKLSNGWHQEREENNSESSEGEEDVKEPDKINSAVNGEVIVPEKYEDIAKMPYRSRSTVYSPTPPLNDAHNDSGYSTRMYGSSKGPSPSLSGTLHAVRGWI